MQLRILLDEHGLLLFGKLITLVDKDPAVLADAFVVWNLQVLQ